MIRAQAQEMELRFASYPENERFARLTVTAFLMDLNPTVDELADVKTAVSEAVTNSIIHGYEEGVGEVQVTCKKQMDQVCIRIRDQGKGIEDIEKAREPFFTTSPEAERSGMGISFMEAFMDEVHITSQVGRGTCVEMTKKLHLVRDGADG
jgi:stage II sporulation protein AB (anti-sigma F factor)